jgi:hypothetical protein
MVKENPIYEFFKRKRDDSVEEQEQEGPPVPSPLIELEHMQHEERPSVVFRGIEFLERDPALRPQIWEYPSNQQDGVRRAYLKLGPMQPKLQNYKAYGPKGHQRRFIFSWFSDFPSWLEYSESSHRAYCLFCFVASKNINRRSGYDTFTVQGFDTWKKVHNGKNCAFLVHVGSDPCSQHNNAVTECQYLLNNPNHIDNVVEVTDNQKKKKKSSAAENIHCSC